MVGTYQNGAEAIQEKLDFNDDSQLLVDKGGSRGIYKNELDSQLARVDDKAKYVAVTWMVECKVMGYDELYDGGISARQIGTNRKLGYNFVTMWSMEALMANLSQSMEYATVFGQKGLFRRRHIISEVGLN